jgi:cysteine-rich repeat protein
MRNSLLKSIWIPVALLGFAIMGSPACGGGDADSGDGLKNQCVPGQSVSCACAAGAEGVQTCGADGNSFSACDCAVATSSSSSGGGACDHGVVTTCGDGAIGAGEECDDGNCIDNDGCTNKCTDPVCGDGIVQTGEDCDDAQSEVDTCPDNCKIPKQDSCVGKVIFTDFPAEIQKSQWVYAGEIGYKAGTKMCQALGADDVCDYGQLKEIVTNQAAHKPDIDKLLAKVPAGTSMSFWVNRMTPEMVNGVVYEPGPGGRCNDWAYETDHRADGEFLTITNTNGALTGEFTLDNDTVYDGTTTHATPGAMGCGSAKRYIPCCFPVCTP